ncbi:hypothetical protein BaRGS_00028322 [Batillaria attramentaria]|uniref:Uncharacterized protein n=1 Tax=Batillaria attramentaria TaxID=370345 RepID=A0ABD0K0R3_9CAEN
MEGSVLNRVCQSNPRRRTRHAAQKAYSATVGLVWLCESARRTAGRRRDRRSGVPEGCFSWMAALAKPSSRRHSGRAVPVSHQALLAANSGGLSCRVLAHRRNYPISLPWATKGELRVIQSRCSATFDWFPASDVLT